MVKCKFCLAQSFIEKTKITDMSIISSELLKFGLTPKECKNIVKPGKVESIYIEECFCAVCRFKDGVCKLEKKFDVHYRPLGDVMEDLTCECE